MATDRATTQQRTPDGLLGRRGKVYRLLRDSIDGCTHEDFRAASIALWRPHVESLSLEAGLAFSFDTESAPGGGCRVRVRLTRDEWDDR